MARHNKRRDLPPPSPVRLIFGYRILEIPPERTAEMTGILLRHGCTADISPTGRLRLGARDYTRICAALPPDLVLSVSEVQGLGGALLRSKNHIPTVITLLLCLIFYFFTGDLVFDIRVSGNETLTEAEITEQLRLVGFELGDRWSKTDKNSVELALLTGCEDIAWVSINRVGTVAYVEVSERQGGTPDPPDTAAPLYSNIVAECDCVIEEITVTSGTPVVRVGDTVHRGDLLISGIVESERGTEYVRAEGTVRGSTGTVLSTEIPREGTETVTSVGERAYLAIKILKIRINLLNNYGNLTEGCAIIDDVKECTLLGKRLPVSVLSGRYATVIERTRRYTDSELALLAGERHRALVNDFLADCDLISVSTEGSFTDGGYLMRSRIVYSVSVGVEQAIATDS